MAGGTVLSGEQTGNAACPHLLGARTWSVALPASHSPIRRPCATARPKGTGGLQTDRSFFPGILDPREVRTRVCWAVISVALGMWSVQEGSGCCDHQAENFHVVTQHRCAVLLKQGHLRAQLLVCADLHPWHAQVRHMGRRGRGCYWQLPQSPRQVVLLLHGRHLPQQQRVRQKAVRVHRVVAAHLGPVPQARRSGAHLLFQQGC